MLLDQDVKVFEAYLKKLFLFISISNSFLFPTNNLSARPSVRPSVRHY